MGAAEPPAAQGAGACEGRRPPACIPSSGVRKPSTGKRADSVCLLEATRLGPDERPQEGAGTECLFCGIFDAPWSV